MVCQMCCALCAHTLSTGMRAWRMCCMLRSVDERADIKRDRPRLAVAASARDSSAKEVWLVCYLCSASYPHRVLG